MKDFFLWVVYSAASGARLVSLSLVEQIIHICAVHQAEKTIHWRQPVYSTALWWGIGSNWYLDTIFHSLERGKKWPANAKKGRGKIWGTQPSAITYDKSEYYWLTNEFIELCIIVRDMEKAKTTCNIAGGMKLSYGRRVVQTSHYLRSIW